MTVWRITEEPRGATYEALVGAAANLCDRFSLYTTGMKLAPSGMEALERLVPSQLAARETYVVPGTTFALETVTLREFQVTPASLSVVVNATDRLFGWAEPALPNDLAFLVGQRELLVAIASEDMATLDVTEDERRAILGAAPSIRLEYVTET